MKYFLLILLIISSVFAYAQDVDSTFNTLDYVNYLYEKGIDKSDGILIISDESKKAINDTTYRKMLYPKNYTWDKAHYLIKNNLLKQAFWHIINLYDINQESKEMAVRIVLAYHKLFDMEQALIGAYYSYAFVDEDVGGIIEGKLTIDNPNILEDKLQNVNELIKYLKSNN